LSRPARHFTNYQLQITNYSCPTRF
jgi:hypothetical protein